MFQWKSDKKMAILFDVTICECVTDMGAFKFQDVHFKISICPLTLSDKGTSIFIFFTNFCIYG
jgi:hypothetical protein